MSLENVNGYIVPEDSLKVDLSEDEFDVISTYAHDTEGLEVSFKSAEVFTFDYEADDYRYWLIRNFGRLALAARQASKEDATSWRGMKIGASIMAIDIDRSRIAFLASGNHKPEENSHTNCAEMNLLLYSDEILKSNYVPLICVAGPDNNRVFNQETRQFESAIGRTALPSSTLFPCQRCHEVMQKEPAINNQTIIATLSKYIDRIQFQTFKEYSKRFRAFNENGDFQDPKVYKFDALDQYWQQNADIYLILRNRQGLLGSDYNDLPERVKARDLLVKKLLHTVSGNFNNQFLG
jgi:hypothetical protein